MSTPAIEAARDEIAEIFGNIAAFWGFTRTQGRVYGLMFVTPGARAHGDIQKRLGISAGSTSMTLSSLVSWGVLRRSDRLYEAETDIWKVITGVFRRRERDQVEDAIARVHATLERLEALGPSERDEETEFVLGRVRQLASFFALGRRFLEAFIAQSPLHDLLATIATTTARFRGRFSTAKHDATTA